MNGPGREGALRALAGDPGDVVPAALLTWDFDYTWNVAGCAPWQLACGGSGTWRRAHLALMERHAPDMIMYLGMGSGPADPVLLAEDADRWTVQDSNTGVVYHLTKVGLSLSRADTGAKSCDPLGAITCRADVDRLLPSAPLWQPNELEEIAGLIGDVGSRALVLPRPSPAYINACYAIGFESAMRMMLDDPDLFLYVVDRFRETDCAGMRQLAGAGVEAVFVSDAWASCDIISPALFDRFALPCQASITRAAHDAGLRIVLWNEGDIRPLLAREASLPVDAFAFEQPRKGYGVTVQEVRRFFGSRRCLFGNLDSEHLLARNEEGEIRREVARQIEMSGPGAPFVVCTGSPLPSSVPPEAVDAMITAAHDYRELGS